MISSDEKNNVQIVIKEDRTIGELAYVEKRYYINLMDKDDHYQGTSERNNITSSLLTLLDRYYSNNKDARKLLLKVANEQEGFRYVWMHINSKNMKEDLKMVRKEFVVYLWEISNLKLKVPVPISHLIAAYWDDEEYLFLMKIEPGSYWGNPEGDEFGLCMYDYMPLNFQILLPEDEKNWNKEDWSHTFHKTRRNVNHFINRELEYRKQFEDDESTL